MVVGEAYKKVDLLNRVIVVT